MCVKTLEDTMGSTAININIASQRAHISDGVSAGTRIGCVGCVQCVGYIGGVCRTTNYNPIQAVLLMIYSFCVAFALLLLYFCCTFAVLLLQYHQKSRASQTARNRDTGSECMCC